MNERDRCNDCGRVPRFPARYSGGPVEETGGNCYDCREDAIDAAYFESLPFYGCYYCCPRHSTECEICSTLQGESKCLADIYDTAKRLLDW